MTLHYYNEIDAGAAAWLRELIKRGLIPNGIVDTRSIEDVAPADLSGFVQCHFFAGIGGWPLALQLAGWPIDRPIWTGSCPCQPFSAAGKAEGFADERHLWPSWHWLIEKCRPAVVVGEQVASAFAGDWLDLVSTDLEALDYAFGAYAGPAAGVGAPHLRDRCYWAGMADADYTRLEGWWQSERQRRVEWIAGARGVAGGMADASGELSEMALQQGRVSRQAIGIGQANELGGNGASGLPSSLAGNWRNADWLRCRDGRWRPVEPGTFPLADGVSARVGRLRGYGNAINPYQAAEFIKALMS